MDSMIIDGIKYYGYNSGNKFIVTDIDNDYKILREFEIHRDVIESLKKRGVEEISILNYLIGLSNIRVNVVEKKLVFKHIWTGGILYTTKDPMMETILYSETGDKIAVYEYDKGEYIDSIGRIFSTDRIGRIYGNNGLEYNKDKNVFVKKLLSKQNKINKIIDRLNRS